MLLVLLVLLLLRMALLCSAGGDKGAVLINIHEPGSRQAAGESRDCRQAAGS
jgi:hypothetical protein